MLVDEGDRENGNQFVKEMTDVLFYVASKWRDAVVFSFISCRTLHYFSMR